MNMPATILLALLGLLLIVAAADDIRRRIIPNRINLAIAVLAIPWWIALHLGGGEVLGQVLAAAIVLILFAFAFHFGMMGGGDVKLLAALALWLPLGQFVEVLVWMAIGGGVLTLAMLLHHRLRRADGRPEIPYGVAIVGSALLVVANDILTSAAA